MNKLVVTFFVILFAFSSEYGFSQEKKTKQEPNVDKRIDNMGYWRRMAKKGYVSVAPDIAPKKATIKGSKLNVKSVLTEDSPDVPVSDTGDDTQSEVSIFVDPTDNSHVLNSNNSVGWTGSNSSTLYGANFLSTENFGVTWGGSIAGVGGENNGDPAAVIGLDGRQYVGFIHSNSGQGVSYSTDGINWTSVVAGTTTGSMLDKNHLWIDNSLTSPYQGNIYDAWTDFGGSMDGNIGFTHSTDGGLTYSTPINLSTAVNAGNLNQGVNIQSGPNGEVYVVWTIYDNYTLDTNAYGFAKSIDGGVSFTPATRIIENVKGIRETGVLKNHRVNSFPSMAVDISGGVNNGNIYMVWSNTGIPGENTGTNKSIYMLKSTDGGATWETPIRVNQGAFENAKEAYFSWITCDPVTGTLSVIFYDDRDVSSTEVETWVANSYDGGATWENFRVSDVAFTPQPIAGLADGYMGDYLGISAYDGMVYPAWPDNRNGYVQTFVSPFETNTRVKPTNLNIALTEGTGQTDLTWDFEDTTSFEYFVVYRDDVEITTTTNLFYTDMLPAYGVFSYAVTAMHDDGESSAARNSIQWGNPNISVDPLALTEILNPNQTSTQVVSVSNTGELDLTYSISSEIATTLSLAPNDTQDYCAATGGGGDEYISEVIFGTINNIGTPQSDYADYTSMSTDIDAGNSYPITITNGDTWGSDDLGIWIDFNHDQDFDDEGENVLCLGNMGGQGTFDIAIPSDALGGQTRMRIRIKYSGDDCGSPCGTVAWGEVEDYSVNINTWLQTETFATVISPGTSENINVHFDATDLEIGDYYATLNISSNDADTPIVAVPITLHVSDDVDLNANASADTYSLCMTSETTLYANAVGGEGTYTYAWTSVPAGFTSTDANPIVAPDENTIYTVVVNDGVTEVTSNVSISIMEALTQPETPVGESILCQDIENSTYTISAVTNATAYEWIIDPLEAGTILGGGLSIDVNWNTDFSGEVMLVAMAFNSCETLESNPLTITINPLPVVNLGTDIETCFDTASFALTTGTPVGGTYSGEGVTGATFDPVSAGVGVHTITYSYSNETSCTGYATQSITVNALPNVSIAAYTDVADNADSFELSGGSPEDGVYTGVGVTDGVFSPEDAGVGIHLITYTYTDPITGCVNSETQTLTVFDTTSITDIVNGVSFSIYPNPNDGLLFIDIETNTNKDLQFTLLNQIGSIVLSKAVFVESTSQTSLDLSQFASGMYYISIKGNELNYFKKIIVQK